MKYKFLLITSLLMLSFNSYADFYQVADLVVTLENQYGERIGVVDSQLENPHQLEIKKGNKSNLSSFDKSIVKASAYEKDGQCSLYLKAPEQNDLNNYYKFFNILNHDLTPPYQNITQEDIYTMIYVHELTHCRQVQYSGNSIEALYRQYINEVDSDLSAYYWAVLNGRLDMANFWLYSRMFSFSKNIDFRHNTSSALADFAYALQEKRIKPQQITVDQFFNTLNQYEQENSGIYTLEQFTNLLSDLHKFPTKDNQSYLILQKDLAGSIYAMFGNNPAMLPYYQDSFFNTWIAYVNENGNSSKSKNN